MVESVFQTLLLLAYFDIALISIAIANFAVSASFLGRESRLSRWRMEKRKKQLDEKVKELQKKGLPIEELNKETEKAQEDIRNIGFRIFLLSWLGAVLLPMIFFVISFTGSVMGMNVEILSQDLEAQRALERQLVSLSSGTLAMGFITLLFVIRAIDSAAKKVPIPEFEITFFENHTDRIVLKRNQETRVDFRIKNVGEDVAEQLRIFVLFPSIFRIVDMPHYSFQDSDPHGDYPNCIVLWIEKDSIPIDTHLHFAVFLTTPDVKNEYEIHVDVCEKKIGVAKGRLFIQIVD